MEGKALLCPFCSSLLEPSSIQRGEYLVAVEGEGPALSLLKHSSLEEVAKLMAAFMVIALEKKGIIPDAVYPDQKANKVLSNHLARFLSVPISKKGKRVLIAGTYPKKILQKGNLHLFFCSKL